MYMKQQKALICKCNAETAQRMPHDLIRHHYLAPSAANPLCRLHFLQSIYLVVDRNNRLHVR